MLSLSHKNLKVYELALELVNEVYLITNSFPRNEEYVLIRQLRRAAISVCSNIAEGASRKSKADKRRFYEVSRSSVVEIDTQIEIASKLKLKEKSAFMNLESYVESVFRILSTMIKNLNS
jgi:four helix bundle protein